MCSTLATREKCPSSKKLKKCPAGQPEDGVDGVTKNQKDLEVFHPNLFLGPRYELVKRKLARYF